MRPVINPDEAASRLGQIFPRAAFDTTLSNALAGWAISSLLYIDAVAPENSEPEIWARPSSVIWQQADVLKSHVGSEDRKAWREAAARRYAHVEQLLSETWGITAAPRFRENSRETLRDEILAGWRDLGAVRQRPGLPTSSSKPRWALEAHFADLFVPTVEGIDLETAIESWTESHLDVGARLRARRARDAATAEYAVEVVLPGGKIRALEHGESSRILKGVIEEWAPRRMSDPVVLTISEPGAKLLVEDQLLLAELGVVIDVANLLPDALIADIGVTPAEFWIVEAVSTDGEINDRRKRELHEWAQEQRIDPKSCRFLTAFASRNASPAKRRLKDLARGTFAWYLDEPDMELSWDILDEGSAQVIPIYSSKR